MFVGGRTFAEHFRGGRRGSDDIMAQAYAVEKSEDACESVNPLLRDCERTTLQPATH